MDKQKTIDEFIDKIVLFFGENEATSSFIKKISGMNGFQNIEVNDNILSYNSKKFSREIMVDKKKKEITLVESGSKEENSIASYYKNKTIYKEQEEKYSVTKENSQSDFFRVSSGVIINNTVFKSIDGYQDNKRSFYSSSFLKRKFEKSGAEEKLLSTDLSKKDFYLLANGDVLKIVNLNNKERYFYCDSSEIEKDVNNDPNKAKFNVELSRDDAEKVLKNLDDAYKLINNDTIFDIRGRLY